MKKSSVFLLYDLFLKCKGNFTTDSRSISVGCLFLALTGKNFNGNSFVDEALKKGAAFAIADDPRKVTPNNRVFFVENGLKALQELANYHRRQLDIPIIAIAGSNGKTTTKELAASVLSKKFRTYFTPGNFNNHIGLPLSILELTKEHEVAILEMGANALGETQLLCEIAQPNFGLVTNIGKDHLEGFGSIENTAKANKELFDYLSKTNGKAFVNAQDHQLMELAQEVNEIITYPRNQDYYSATIVPSDFGMAFRSKNGRIIHTQLFGTYNFMNAMGAMAIGNYFGVDENAALDAIEAYEPKNNRSQLIKTAFNSIVADAYNANPSSMALALKSFKDHPSKLSKIVVLGEMAELGSYSESEHLAIGQLVKALGFNEVFLVGKEMEKVASTYPIFTHFPSVEDLYKEWKRNPPREKFILLKGSRRNKLEELIEVV